MNNKIGIGLITCNSVEKLKQTAHFLKGMDELVIVNDGLPYNNGVYPVGAEIIQHEKNYGVAKAKNDALKFLMGKNCNHLFLIEDDVIIKGTEVFEKYITAGELSGIKHFNYALQGPNNRLQKKELLYQEKNIFEKTINTLVGKKLLLSKWKGLSESDRIYLDETSAPNPKLVYKYSKDISLAFYTHCVGAMSYYHRDVIEKVGYLDENFINAWEHIHHTYNIIKAGFHPPFWWFADLADGDNYIDNIPNCMSLSTIAKSDAWKDNVNKGEQYFKSLEGLTPGQIPVAKKREVLKELITFQNIKTIASPTR